MADNRYIGAVQHIEIYRNDVVVKRKGVKTNDPETVRGEIREFSKASRKRLAFVAINSSVSFRQLVTLTYPRQFPQEGETVKRHLRKFLTWLQKDTQGCDYLWFFEFQKRGAPHIHILTDAIWPRKRDLVTEYRFRIACAWYRIVGSGDERHLSAGTSAEKLRSPEGGAHYAVKYASKMYQKIVPPGFGKCGRFWGHTRNVKPKVERTVQLCEDDIRATLEGWEFMPGEDRPVYKVLYNQAERFRSYLDDTQT